MALTEMEYARAQGVRTPALKRLNSGRITLEDLGLQGDYNRYLRDQAQKEAVSNPEVAFSLDNGDSFVEFPDITGDDGDDVGNAGGGGGGSASDDPPIVVDPPVEDTPPPVDESPSAPTYSVGDVIARDGQVDRVVLGFDDNGSPIFGPDYDVGDIRINPRNGRQFVFVGYDDDFKPIYEPVTDENQPDILQYTGIEDLNGDNTINQADVDLFLDANPDFSLDDQPDTPPADTPPVDTPPIFNPPVFDPPPSSGDGEGGFDPGGRDPFGPDVVGDGPFNPNPPPAGGDDAPPNPDDPFVPDVPVGGDPTNPAGDADADGEGGDDPGGGDPFTPGGPIVPPLEDREPIGGGGVVLPSFGTITRGETYYPPGQEQLVDDITLAWLDANTEGNIRSYFSSPQNLAEARDTFDIPIFSVFSGRTNNALFGGQEVPNFNTADLSAAELAALDSRSAREYVDNLGTYRPNQAVYDRYIEQVNQGVQDAYGDGFAFDFDDGYDFRPPAGEDGAPIGDPTTPDGPPPVGGSGDQETDGDVPNYEDPVGNPDTPTDQGPPPQGDPTNPTNPTDPGYDIVTYPPGSPPTEDYYDLRDPVIDVGDFNPAPSTAAPFTAQIQAPAQSGYQPGQWQNVMTPKPRVNYRTNTPAPGVQGRSREEAKQLAEAMKRQRVNAQNTNGGSDFSATLNNLFG